MESTLHSIEVELESVRVQLEEEAEARLDLERQLSKANQDVLSWKSKYEHECSARTEEVEELRYNRSLLLISSLPNLIIIKSNLIIKSITNKLLLYLI